jgi:2-isopropylmalate synthase
MRIASSALMTPNSYIYDWNAPDDSTPAAPAAVELMDDTLRDGLQNPSVTDPDVSDKLELVGLMAELGIHAAGIGLPASSQRTFEHCLSICREIGRGRLGLGPVAAARTLERDVARIAELAQRSGVAVEAHTFVGLSPIRALVEQWDIDVIQRNTVNAIDLAVREGLSVAFVAEDATRSRPEVLFELFRVAVDHGARRVCLCDTVGHIAPWGVRRLVERTSAHLAGLGVEVALDWHGHNDRGLGLANALEALRAGVDRVHGTALGIGERVGNTPMELLLLNLKLSGLLGRQRLDAVTRYCHSAARSLGWDIPVSYPLVGRDAFRTATGIHAAAIAKAEARGDAELAELVYSSVPASLFGRTQDIGIGHQSGHSNVEHWLRVRGFEPERALVETVLERAKRGRGVLPDPEILQIVKTYFGARPRRE